VRARMFNAELLLRGLAEAMTIAPNTKYAEMFLRFQSEAKSAGVGIWAAPVGSGGSGGVVTPGVVVISVVDLVGEVVTIRNTSSAAVDISGWVLVSTVGDQRFTFPAGSVLGGNSSFRVTSGSNATSSTGVFLWTRSNVWNNAGDQAVLLNSAGVEVSRRD